MISREQRKSIIEFSRKCVADNDLFHGMGHMSETAENAMMLAEKEGADSDLCWAAAILHDICKSSNGDHGAEGAEKARRFLLELGIPEEFCDKVHDAIYFHNKGFSDGPVERRILWDADKLPLMKQEGFRERALNYWKVKLGKDKGRQKAVADYYFFRERFHTTAAKKIVEEHRQDMEKLLKKVSGDGS